ncbi:MAG: calcium-binding protein [Candidatus Krumholzibacteria bacterium]|nr:calcium-binding protein [Candidatus Krumholzibacteria bacterium]
MPTAVITHFRKSPGLSWGTFVDFGGWTALDLLANSTFTAVSADSATIGWNADEAYTVELTGSFIADGVGGASDYTVNRATVFHDGLKIQEWSSLDWTKGQIDDLRSAVGSGDFNAFDVFLATIQFTHIIKLTEHGLVMTTFGDDVVKAVKVTREGGLELFTYDGDDRIDLSAAGVKGGSYIGAGPGDDIVIGGPRVDFLFGEDGDDILRGGGGNDSLKAGGNSSKGHDGNDTLFGQDGNDRLEGDTGDDRHFGGNGNDWIYDIWGKNVLSGGAGNDSMDGIGTLSGGAGNDSMDGIGTLSGGAGNDYMDGIGTLSGGAGNDQVYGIGTLSGSRGDDVVYGLGRLMGGPGNDVVSISKRFKFPDKKEIENVLDGGAGNDVLSASSYRGFTATLRGGKGDDTFVSSNFNGVDTIDFNLNGDRSFGNDRFKDANSLFDSFEDVLVFDAGVEIELDHLRKRDAILITATLDGREIGTITMGWEKDRHFYRYDFKEWVEGIDDILVFA